MMPGRSGGAKLGVFLAASMMMMFVGLMAATKQLGSASLPIWFAALGSTTVVLRGPVGKAIAARIGGEAADDPTAELRAVADQAYAELDEMRSRLLEVEERLDFAERMLAQRSADAIGPEG